MHYTWRLCNDFLILCIKFVAYAPQLSFMHSLLWYYTPHLLFLQSSLVSTKHFSLRGDAFALA